MSHPLKKAAALSVALAVRMAIAQEAAPAEPAPEDSPIAVEGSRPEVEIDLPGGEVTVLGRREGNIQKETTQVISVLSSEDIARTGEGDIAGALGRLAGLSVVGNGFVYVRGLGDRYSLAMLNGSPLPSPEPLKRAVPLDIFPTDVIASSLVQKTYSTNFPAEFGGGVINLTTLAVPKAPFLNINLGGSGDTETTGQPGYDYFGSNTDWTGFGSRELSPSMKSFLAGGQPISGGAVDTNELAKGLVAPANGLVQHINDVPVNYSGSLTGGESWMIGESQLGLIVTGGYSNSWRTRDNLEQTPGSTDLSTTNKDYHAVETGNRIISNALLGLGYEFGDGNQLRWTNLYVHDTLKRSSLSEGKWNVTYTDWDFLEQETGYYKRELLTSQLSGGMKFGDISVDARASWSRSRRDAPYELTMGYARNNVAADPFGAYFINRLSGQNRNYATVAFSDLTEDLWSAGVSGTWRISPDLAVTAGYDFADTKRDSARREFQIRAPSTFPSEIGLLRPDLLLGPAVIEQFDIRLVEPTETDPAFGAKLLVNGAFLQGQAQLTDTLDLSLGLRYERARQDVEPIQVFATPSNSGASTHLDNDYVLPAATLTWRFANSMQARFSASQTIARPQFRELMFQKYFDPDSNRDYLGNPLLIDSEFINAEARYEWYYAPEQRLSLAAFYKDIDRPIEAYTSYPEGDSPVTSYANAPKARLYGGELEVLKYLPLGDFTDASFLASRRAVLIANYTYTNSRINVGSGDTVEIYGSSQTSRPASEYFIDGSPLTGQSDHLVNLQFGLEQTGKLSQQTILLSYASDRVTSRAGGSSPDIMESPGLRVDFVARQGVTMFGAALDLKLEVRNILGEGYSEFQQSGPNTIYYNRYDIGTSFAFSVTANF